METIKKFFKRFFSSPAPFTGALLDNRPLGAKQDDIFYEELFAGTSSITWKFKPQSQWKRFTVRNQGTSSSCVAQSIAKILEIKNSLEENRIIQFSASPIYRRRVNFPEQGMRAYDAFDIATKYGSTFEALVRSQGMTEKEMNDQTWHLSDVQIGKIFREAKGIDLPRDIDVVADAIERGGCAMVWFAFDSEEWTDIPAIHKNGRSMLHSVVAVDYFTFGNEKAILIEDSWGKFGAFEGQRVITESFFNRACIFAAAFMDLSNDPDAKIDKPKYFFSRSLIYGFSDDADVKELQRVLRYEGLFPTTANFTGNYGSVTADSVLAFQKKYSIDSPEALDALKGRRVGEKTLAKLNQLYS